MGAADCLPVVFVARSYYVSVRCVLKWLLVCITVFHGSYVHRTISRSFVLIEGSNGSATYLFQSNVVDDFQTVKGKKYWGFKNSVLNF